MAGRTYTPEEMKRRIANLNRSVHDKLMDAVEEAATHVEEKAKANCEPETSPYPKAPYQTGTLAGNITHEVEEKGNQILGKVGTKIEYAPFVHEGTSKMAPRPFILDAAVSEKDEVLEILKKGVEDAIREEI